MLLAKWKPHFLSDQLIPVSLMRPDARLVGESLGQGRDILLLHAGGENRTVWRPVMHILANHGFRSVAYDQRSHGESSGSTVDGVQAFGEDATAMIHELNKPIVVGGSLGGFALMLALEACEPLVSGLVLVDVTPRPNPEKTRQYLSARGELGSSPLVGNILSQRDRITKIVSKFSVPILFVGAGERSPIDPPARDEFSAMCPHANIKSIDHASHLVARDAPSELALLIIEFVESAIARVKD